MTFKVSVFLFFPGVNPYKAGKFRAEDGSGEKATQEVDSRYDIFEGDSGEGEKDEKYFSSVLFSWNVSPFKFQPKTDEKIGRL